MVDVIDFYAEKAKRHGMDRAIREADALMDRVTEAYERLSRQIDEFPKVAKHRKNNRTLLALCTPQTAFVTMRQLSGIGFRDFKTGVIYGIEVYEEKDPVFAISYDHPIGIVNITRNFGYLGVYGKGDGCFNKEYLRVKRGDVLVDVQEQ